MEFQLTGNNTQAAPPRAMAWIVAVIAAATVAGLNALVWFALNQPLAAPAPPSRISGMAYNAFGRWDNPLLGRLPDAASIEQDLAMVATLTGQLRTYSASEFPDLPRLAQAHGIRITQGVWLDTRAANNQREIAAAIDAAQKHPNVQRIMAGNETQLHRTVPPQQLYATLDHLRRNVRVPVSTAEPWHVWLSQPELAKHVDFITVHLLPYWEGQPIEAALDHAMARLEDVRKRFPGRLVVIGEVGWPSRGDAVGDAVASTLNQARFTREFLARAPREGALDYFLMEAVDQPWKRSTEGRVGAHWGVWNAAREAKFNWHGPLLRDPFWVRKAVASSALGFVGALAAWLAWPRFRRRARVLMAVVAQGVATTTTLLLSLPLLDYLRNVEAAAWLLLVPAVALMAALVLVHVVEFAEMFWSQHLQARQAERPWVGQDDQAPFVSVHLACSNEPPAMVIATLNSLLALDWPAFEVIVVDNNTRDEACWRPLQAQVERWQAQHPALAHRLKFIHLPTWPGFKAGALNVALEASDARTQWVAVVDADYVVDPAWLRQLGGWFEVPDVGVVQSPQAHRDWQHQSLARMMNWEYEGFFRIGMHHRHERNAIIQHGTMTIVRARALRDVGAWSVASVCEDSELGLRLLAQGLRVLYVDRVFGTGLVPHDFDAYARQRKRWATGAMQILKTHARSLFGASGLSLAQRYHFVAGWLPWLGDAMHWVFTLAAVAWSLAMLLAPGVFALPVATFAAPVVAYFVGRALLVPLLYRRNVPCSIVDVLGATAAGMALSHAVARGVLAGLVRTRSTFEITRKAGTPAVNPDPVRQERWLLIALAACGAALAIRADAPSASLAGWLAVLALQAVPYLMALLCQHLGAAAHRPVLPHIKSASAPEGEA